MKSIFSFTGQIISHRYPEIITPESENTKFLSGLGNNDIDNQQRRKLSIWHSFLSINNGVYLLIKSIYHGQDGN